MPARALKYHASVYQRIGCNAGQMRSRVVSARLIAMRVSLPTPRLQAMRGWGKFHCQTALLVKSVARYKLEKTQTTTNLGDSFMTRITRAICATGALISVAALATMAYADGRDYNDGAVQNVT